MYDDTLIPLNNNLTFSYNFYMKSNNNSCWRSNANLNLSSSGIKKSRPQLILAYMIVLIMNSFPELITAYMILLLPLNDNMT